MDNEVPIEQSIDKLLEMKLSLTEILGPGWKNNAIFPDVETALKEEGIKALTDGQDLLPNEAQSDLDKFIVETNSIFQQNNTIYHARRFFDKQGNEKIMIAGSIGKDTFFQTIEPKYAFIENDFPGIKASVWKPETMGLVSENGQVLRFDKIIQANKNIDEINDIVFIEKTGRKYSANMRVKSSEGNDIVILLPENYQQLGTFLHELGHLLRGRVKSRDPQLEAASIAAHDEYVRTAKTGLPFNKNAKISSFQMRKIKANEERGAWALGISLFKEAGLSIGLDCASPEAITIMMKRAEQCLKTYDEVPYTFLEHGETSPIPSFSQERKKDANKLHKYLIKQSIPYSSLSSFDDKTGENLANNPKKVLDKIIEAKT